MRRFGRLIASKMPSWWKDRYWLQVADIIIFTANVASAITTTSWFAPLNWMAAGYVGCMFFTHARFARLYDTLSEMQAAMHAVMEMKASLIGEEIAAQFRREADDELPRITKH